MGKNNFFILILGICFSAGSLMLVSAATNQKFAKYRFFLGSIIGSFMVVVINNIPIFIRYSIAFFLPIFLSILVVVFVPKSIKNLFILMAVFLAYILLGWGVSYFYQLIFFRVLKFSGTSLMLFYLTKYIILFLIMAVLIIAFKRIYYFKYIKNFLFDVEIDFGHQINKCKLFFDSGNGLYDEFSGLPVIVLSIKIINNLKDCSNFLCNKRKIRYETINGSDSEMSVVMPRQIKVQLSNGSYKKIYAMVGFVDKRFKYFDGLLPSGIELGE